MAMILTNKNPLVFLYLMLSSTTLNVTNIVVSGKAIGGRATVPKYRPSAANRNLIGILYSEVSGNSTQEICQSFKIAHYSQALVDRFGTECSCEEFSVDGSFYIFSCADRCELCYDGQEDCGIYTVDGTLRKNTGLLEGGFFIEYSKTCMNYNDASFDSAEVCYIEDYTQSVGETWMKVTIDDVACNSVSGAGNCAVSIDCANLNYGSNMDPCDLNTLTGQGPFEHFFVEDITLLELGQCSSGATLEKGCSSGGAILGTGRSSAAILGTGMIFVVPFLALVFMPW